MLNGYHLYQHSRDLFSINTPGRLNYVIVFENANSTLNHRLIFFDDRAEFVFQLSFTRALTDTNDQQKWYVSGAKD